MPVDQLDHARRLAEGADAVLDSVAFRRVDQPDAAVGEQRVRGDAQPRALRRDPAEPPLLLVDEPGQSLHHSCSSSASPGPVFGAPIAISSAPSGPPSKPRTASLSTRSASNGPSSSTSSPTFARRLPLTTTYTSSCVLWLCANGSRNPGAIR